MPRTTGVMSLPVGNPVVSNSPISSSWANTTLSDIANEITNSLPRDGTAPMTQALKLTDGVASAPGISFNTESSTGIFKPASGSLSISTAGVERLRIDSNGKLGIGTVSPTAKLDVAGSIAISGSASRITGDFSNITVANRVIFQTSTVNGETNIHAIPNGTGARAWFEVCGSSDPANTSFTNINTNAAAGISVLEAGKRGTGTYLPLTLWTSATERMRIDASGNVGIGNTSPSSIFHVTQHTGQPPIFEADASYSPSIEFRDKAGSVNRWRIGSGSSAPTDGNFFVYDARQSLIRLIVDTSGNLGIGTVVPAYSVDVGDATGRKVIRIGGGSTNANDGSALYFRAGVATHAIGNVSAIVGGAYNADLALYSATGNTALYNGGTERVRITSAGNVGIGTTSPGSALHVSSASQMSLFASTTADGYVKVTETTGDAILGSTNGVGFVGTAAANAFGIRTGNTERVRITAAGNVGIGTTSPSDALHVKGATQSLVISEGGNGWGGFHAKASGTNPSYMFFGNTAAGETGRIASWSDNSLRFGNGTAATERMCITASGSVGIGTSAPPNLLHAHNPSGTANLGLSSSATANVGVQLSNAVRSYGINNNTSGNLEIYDNNAVASRLIVATNGTIYTAIENTANAYKAYANRAWVNFNGSGAVGSNQPIRACGGVSSVYKNATGDYTINFTEVQYDTNYAVVGVASGLTSPNAGNNVFVLGEHWVSSTQTLKSTTAVRVVAVDNNTDSPQEAMSISVAIIR